MPRILVFVVFAIFSHASFAGVKSLGAPVEVTNSKGQKYTKVDVRCDNSDLRPSIRKRSGAIKWCSSYDNALCAKSKMTLALKVCNSRNLANLKSKIGGGSSGESKVAEKEIAAKKSELDIEREKIEIEKQRIELEKQRVVLQQLQAELQKLEFELQRDSAN